MSHGLRNQGGKALLRQGGSESPSGAIWFLKIKIHSVHYMLTYDFGHPSLPCFAVEKDPDLYANGPQEAVPLAILKLGVGCVLVRLRSRCPTFPLGRPPPPFLVRGRGRYPTCTISDVR